MVTINSGLAVALGAILHSLELTSPVAFETARPLVHGLDLVGVRPVVRLPTFPSHIDQADVQQHTQVLGHRRLRHLQCVDDVVDRPGAWRQELENVAPTRFGNRVEGVGRGGGARHGKNHMPITEYVKHAMSPRATRGKRRRRALVVEGQLEALRHPVERAAIDAEDLGDARPVAADSSQHVLEVTTFEFVELREISKWMIALR